MVFCPLAPLPREAGALGEAARAALDGAAREARALDGTVRETGAFDEPAREALDEPARGAGALDEPARELAALERFGPGAGLFARVARERAPAAFLGGFLDGLTRAHPQFRPLSGIAKRIHRLS